MNSAEADVEIGIDVIAGGDHEAYGTLGLGMLLILAVHSGGDFGLSIGAGAVIAQNEEAEGGRVFGPGAKLAFADFLVIYSDFVMIFVIRFQAGYGGPVLRGRNLLIPDRDDSLPHGNRGTSYGVRALRGAPRDECTARFQASDIGMNRLCRRGRYGKPQSERQEKARDGEPGHRYHIVTQRKKRVGRIRANLLNSKGNYMNWEQVEKRWPIVAGSFRERFEQLTDGEMERLTGKKDELIIALQSAYGYSGEAAELHLTKWQNLAADSVEDTPTSTSGAPTY